MMAIAPNLTMMVGELVGARLIAHAGTDVLLLAVELTCMHTLHRVADEPSQAPFLYCSNIRSRESFIQVQ